ncbi:c-type cytochrome [Altericroceibacterium endophyticum]|uniref:C-type cytochrome n=1 Tax=Altericroceibacterium endophyticum TaxID=1808508 RepID=A0A6I4T2B3_9SPHN|nr:cytochrome c family protein [Altericroceibacterium endophyticum]MXO65057.1 c-type cytochrome [Altericroceibacterium endophyticum]
MNDRFNTIFGWALFSGVVALGLSSISSRIFHADKPDRPEQMGYTIEGVAEEGGDEGPSLAMLLSEADASKGESTFAKCVSCHTIDQGGADGIGPNLYGVVGKPIGKHAAGFAYSSVLSEHGGNWDFANLDEWLKSPRAFAPGTKMSFAGLSKPEDRANVIAFLNEHGSNIPYPEVEAPAAEEGAADAEDTVTPGDTPEAAGAMASDEPTEDTTSTPPVE